MAQKNGSGSAQEPLPAVDFLKIPEHGDPYLEGHKCGACGSVFVGARTVCSKCGARDQMKPIHLSNRGELYVYTIVHRSFPGIEVPYISAVVDLEGGGTVKGNLINIDPDPEKLRPGMPVEVVYKDALGRKDREGHSYLSYFFQPRSS
jgi:uncharacterized OB-fold protein